MADDFKRKLSLATFGPLRRFKLGLVAPGAFVAFAPPIPIGFITGFTAFA
jgi:hypothetical protein